MKAFVLPVTGAASSEPQAIPGVPGLWTPGEAQTAKSLGRDHDELAKLNAENGGLLEEVAGADDETPDLARTGGLVSSSELASSPMATLPRSASDVPGLSAEDAAAREKQRSEDVRAGRVHPAMATMVPPEAVAAQIEGSARDLAASVGERTDPELRVMATDDRKGVREAATAELARRAQPETTETEG